MVRVDGPSPATIVALMTGLLSAFLHIESGHVGPRLLSWDLKTDCLDTTSKQKEYPIGSYCGERI